MTPAVFGLFIIGLGLVIILAIVKDYWRKYEVEKVDRIIFWVAASLVVIGIAITAVSFILNILG